MTPIETTARPSPPPTTGPSGRVEKGRRLRGSILPVGLQTILFTEMTHYNISLSIIIRPVSGKAKVPTRKQAKLLGSHGTGRTAWRGASGPQLASCQLFYIRMFGPPLPLRGGGGGSNYSSLKRSCPLHDSPPG